LNTYCKSKTGEKIGVFGLGAVKRKNISASFAKKMQKPLDKNHRSQAAAHSNIFISLKLIVLF
jgi:hypothetical protein